MCACVCNIMIMITTDISDAKKTTVFEELLAVEQGG